MERRNYQNKSNYISWVSVINWNSAMTHCHYFIQCFPESERKKRQKALEHKKSGKILGLKYTGIHKPTNQELYPDQGKMHLILASWQLWQSFQSFQVPRQ